MKGWKRRRIAVVMIFVICMSVSSVLACIVHRFSIQTEQDQITQIAESQLNAIEGRLKTYIYITEVLDMLVEENGGSISNFASHAKISMSIIRHYVPYSLPQTGGLNIPIL